MIDTWLLLLSGLVILYLFLIRPRFHKAASKPFLQVFYAHRGLHDIKRDIPENSLPAFEAAVQAGYGIEMDVQLTADGVPVVFHDATLSRMCAIDRRVDSMTFAELQELTLADTQEKIPAFAEALSLVNGQVPLLIEIKMDRLDLRIPALIDQALIQYKGAYCIESFHPAALWWYRKYRPGVLRGQLSTHFNVENRTLSIPQYLLGKMVLNVFGRPDFISYNWRFRRDLSLFLCRRLFGAHTAAWVIRSAGELQTCKKSFQMYIFEDFRP